MRSRLLVLFVFFAWGCEAETKRYDNHRQFTWKSGVMNEAARAIAECNEVLDKTPICTSLNQTSEYCAFEPVRFSSAEALDSSKGQRILVIDDGMRLLSYTRYKKRVLAHFVPEEICLSNDLVDADRPLYVPINQPIYMPKAARMVLSDILGEHFGRLPAELLQPLKRPLLDKFEGLGDGYDIGHGNLIFAFLANHNPDAQFVLMQPPGLPDELFCHHDAAKRMDMFVNRLVEFIKMQIRYYDINFINYSAGYTYDFFVRAASRCARGTQPANKQIAEIYNLYVNNFYRPLGEISGVIFVQAGMYAVGRFDVNNPHLLADCLELPFRLRVGYMAQPESGMPFGGGDFQSYGHLLFPDQFDARHCIDVYINSGWRDRPPYQLGKSPLKISAMGIGNSSDPEIPMGTSWAVPAMLSYLIYMRNTLSENGQLTVDQLLEVARDPKRAILDPERDRMFDIYRLFTE